MGRPKNIKTPEILWKLFEDYVKHEAENPMHKVEYVGKEGRVEKTPLETPITFMGFECWLWDNDYINNLSDYQKNKDERYTEFAPIITRITQNCYVHNFKGASVGIFNANIIARKLGLTEKQEVSQTTHTINLAG
jgi:hypothetical protein